MLLWLLRLYIYTNNIFYSGFKHKLVLRPPPLFLSCMKHSDFLDILSLNIPHHLCPVGKIWKSLKSLKLFKIILNWRVKQGCIFTEFFIRFRGKRCKMGRK